MGNNKYLAVTFHQGQIRLSLHCLSVQVNMSRTKSPCLGGGRRRHNGVGVPSNFARGVGNTANPLSREHATSWLDLPSSVMEVST